MSRIVRILFFIGGLAIVALLILRTGPALLLDMLARVGWSFPAVAAVYAVHQGVRAAALWRSVLSHPVRYADVLRIRLVGEAVEMLTFTGPFLAEPAKGWLLKHRGLPIADAFATVAIEYLLYTAVSALMATVAFSLLLAHGALPNAFRPVAVGIVVATVAFNAAVGFATITGIGLIVPMVRASGAVIGALRAALAAERIDPVERVLVSFLHDHPARLAEVLAIEIVAHALLMLEIWVVLAALGLPFSWLDPLVVEGAVKFIGAAFFFIPGQVGASEGVYALLLSTIGLSAATGLTLALVRRVRGLLVAGAGLLALVWIGEP